MRIKFTTILTLFICLIFGEELLFNSAVATEAVRTSLELCIITVIPSLFCFMVLSAFISGSGIGKILSIPLLPLVKWLKLPSNCGSIILMSLLGGYPAGIKGIKDGFENGQFDETLVKRLCLFCICPAPSFVIVALGERILGNQQAGILLYLSQLGAVLILGVGSSLFSKTPPKGERLRYLRAVPPKSFSTALVDAVNFSCETLLNMCGFIVLFGVISSVLGQLPINREQYSILSATLEISAGSKALAESESSLRLTLLAFFLSFGGISTIFQLKSILKSVPCSIGRLLSGRILQGFLSTVLFEFLIRCFPQVVSVLATDTKPLAIHDPSTPVLSGCLIGMMLILLNNLNLDHKIKNK